MRIAGPLVVLAGVAFALVGTPALGASTSPPSADTVQTRSDSGAKCDQQIAKRQGAWFCNDGGTARAGGPFVSPGTAQSPSNLTRCAGSGFETQCWTNDATVNGNLGVSADFNGSMDYGYGSTFLGSANVRFQDTNRGNATVAGYFYSTSPRTRTSMTWAMQRLYLSSACAGGCASSTECPKRSGSLGTVGASSQARPTYYGCVLDTAYGTVWHQQSWRDPQYPGTWSVYVKSIKTTRYNEGNWFWDIYIPSSVQSWTATG